MKSLPTFLSMVVLLWLLATVVPLQRIRGHWMLVVFLAAQFAFTSLCFMSLQKVGRDSDTYHFIFAGAMCAAVAAALVLSLTWAAEMGFGVGLLALLTSFMAPLGASCVVFSYSGSKSALYIIGGSLFLFPAMLALLSSVLPVSPSDTMVRLCVGIFWMLIAAYFYATGASLSNANLQAAPRAAWIPSLVAILCFGVLAYSLSRAQYETSRAALHADVAIEEAR